MVGVAFLQVGMLLQVRVKHIKLSLAKYAASSGNTAPQISAMYSHVCPKQHQVHPTGSTNRQTYSTFTPDPV